MDFWGTVIVYGGLILAILAIACLPREGITMALDGGFKANPIGQEDAGHWRNRILDEGGLVQDASTPGIMVSVAVTDRILEEFRRDIARRLIARIPERHVVLRNELEGWARQEWGK